MLGERYGAVTAARVVAVAALAVVLSGQIERQVLSPARDAAARVFWVSWCVLAAVLVVTLPVTGHAGSSATPVLSSLLDAAHLWAAGVWFAGVLALGQCVVWALRGRGRNAQVRVFGGLLERFARLAPVAVALVGLTGVATSWQAFDSWHQVASTDYGALLTVKVVFFVAVLFFGALNHFVLLPALRQRTEAAEAFQSRETAVTVLRYEVACAVVLLVVTAVLTGLGRPA